jgi:phage-related protein
MPYEAYFYIDGDKTRPVLDYIRGLSAAERAKTYAFIRHLIQHGPQTPRPAADYLGDGTGLYELRPKPHRYLYFFFLREKIVLLHAFEKDTQAIRYKDIRIALERKNSVLNYGKISKLEFEEGANET